LSCVLSCDLLGLISLLKETLWSVKSISVTQEIVGLKLTNSY